MLYYTFADPSVEQRDGNPVAQRAHMDHVLRKARLAGIPDDEAVRADMEETYRVVQQRLAAEDAMALELALLAAASVDQFGSDDEEEVEVEDDTFPSTAVERCACPHCETRIYPIDNDDFCDYCWPVGTTCECQLHGHLAQ